MKLNHYNVIKPKILPMKSNHHHEITRSHTQQRTHSPPPMVFSVPKRNTYMSSLHPKVGGVKKEEKKEEEEEKKKLYI